MTWHWVTTASLVTNQRVIHMIAKQLAKPASKPLCGGARALFSFFEDYSSFLALTAHVTTVRVSLVTWSTVCSKSSFCPGLARFTLRGRGGFKTISHLMSPGNKFRELCKCVLVWSLTFVDTITARQRS